MLVVDTNIVAYLLIEGDRTKQAQALYAKDSDWRSEAFLLVEFSNVLATYRRLRALSGEQTETLLTEAATRVRELLSVPNLRALRCAERFAVSAYDARFLAAADTLGTKLVTEDAKLRAAAPGLTRSLAQALAA
jgi:predicted nucleic acid-binding protein